MSDPPRELARLRDEVLQCDRKLIEAIAHRRTLVKRIGALKRQLGLPVTDPVREAAVARRAAEMARAEGLNDELVREVVWKVMAAAREEQHAAVRDDEGGGPDGGAPEAGAREGGAPSG